MHGGREIRKEPLNVITPTIEGYLRASLRKAVNLAVSNNTGPKKAWMEWDKMIYEKCTFIYILDRRLNHFSCAFSHAAAIA